MGGTKATFGGLNKYVYKYVCHKIRSPLKCWGGEQSNINRVDAIIVS